MPWTDLYFSSVGIQTDLLGGDYFNILKILIVFIIMHLWSAFHLEMRNRIGELGCRKQVSTHIKRDLVKTLRDDVS